MSMMEPGWIWQLSGRDFLHCVIQSGLLDRNSNERRPYARPVLKLKQECKRKIKPGYSLCECGALKGRNSKRCKACRYRLASPKTTCADCGVKVRPSVKCCVKCVTRSIEARRRFCECGAVLARSRVKQCSACYHKRRAAAKIALRCACGVFRRDYRSKSCSSCAAKERYARYGAVILQRGKAA